MVPVFATDDAIAEPLTSFTHSRSVLLDLGLGKQQSSPVSDYGRARQASIFIRGLAGRRPRVPIDPHALEQKARESMSPEGFAYVAGGAGIESTMRANRDAFDRWKIVPRLMRNVSERDMSVTLFGRRLPSPVLLAPIGVLEMAHRKADVAVAAAAAREGVPCIFSSQASVPMEKCAAVMGDSPRWFQLYWNRSDDLVRSFIARAERSGCEAIVVTVDTAFLGWRSRDLELAYNPFMRGLGIAQYTSDPVFREMLSAALEGPPAEKPPLTLDTVGAAAKIIASYPGSLGAKIRSGEPRKAVQRFLASFSRPSLTWDNLSFLRDLTKLPILIKGIQHPDDAREAVGRGIDGVIVSNHGGRQVDGAIGSLDALPEVVAAAGGKIPVLFDSGIRGGADIFKAISLGATAVCIGRPYVYGLAIAGEEGVVEVIRNMIAELDLTMGLTGCARLDELTTGMLSAQGR
jgi:lactate 2-monooxygenase